MDDGNANGEAKEFGVDGVAGLFVLYGPPFAATGEKKPEGDWARPVGDGAGESFGFFDGGCPEKAVGWGAGDGLNWDAGEKVLWGT